MVSDSDPYNSSNIKCLRLVGMFDFAGGFRLNFCLDVTKSRTAFEVSHILLKGCLIKSSRKVIFWSIGILKFCAPEEEKVSSLLKYVTRSFAAVRS